MSRTRNKRKHLTETYQKKQLNRTPQHDRLRRPELLFLCKLANVDNYENNLANEVTPDIMGYYRNHSAWSCSCRMCRIKSLTPNAVILKRKTYKQDADYKDGLDEYYSISIALSDTTYDELTPVDSL